MRVIIIADKPIHYRVDLFNAMARLYGSEIFFFFTPDPRFPARNAISVFTGEPFLLLSSFFNYQSEVKRGLKLLSNLHKKNADIIMNFGASPRLFFLALYAKILRKRLFIWWGGTRESEKRIVYLKHFYRRCLLRFVDGVLCYSKLAAEYIQDLAGPRVKCWVLGNNTFDSQRYHAEIARYRSEACAARHSLKVLTVGFLTEQKNTITLLRSYRTIKLRYPNVCLQIVGDGPDLDHLKSYIRECSLRDVYFTGFVEFSRMPAYYAEADIFVHPSTLDRWPQTFNEAAAAGLPILISRTSGVTNPYTEMYADTVLFDFNDEVRLSSLLELLITNPSLRKQLGAAAQQAAFDFDCNFVLQNITRIFNGEYS